MTDAATTEELASPVAHVTIVYLGPVAPHWEVRPHFGDEKLIEGFRTRLEARLLLLPKHDPQFRRNRERVNRDAERELIRVDWDLGDEMAPTDALRRVEEAATETPVADTPAEDAPAATAPPEAAEASGEAAVSSGE